MGENIATPRISHAYLEAFANQTVRIVGRVTQLRGEQATLDASGGDVTLILTRDSHLKLDNGAEVVGRVNPDLTIKVLAATDLGSSVDYNAVAAVVEATHRHKEIFYNPDV